MNTQAHTSNRKHSSRHATPPSGNDQPVRGRTARALGATVVLATVCLTTVAQATTNVYRFQQGVYNGLTNSVSYTADSTWVNDDPNARNSVLGGGWTLQTKDSAGNKNYSLFGFDVSAASGIVQSASLSLTVNYDGGFSDPNKTYSFRLYELPSGNTNWSTSTATFNDQVTADGTKWVDFAGNLTNAAAAGSSGTLLYDTGVFNPVNNQQVVFNISGSDAQRWVDDPSAFGGLFLRQVNNGTGTDRVIWWSGDNGQDLSYRPLMTITTIPEPTTALLLLLGGAGLAIWRRVRR